MTYSPNIMTFAENKTLKTSGKPARILGIRRVVHSLRPNPMTIRPDSPKFYDHLTQIL